MNSLILKEVEVIEPPFSSPLNDLVGWVKATTISVKGEELVGGLMVSSGHFVCSKAVSAPDVKVQFCDNTTAHAARIDGGGNISFYKLDKPLERWVGLPNRTEQLQSDSFLFSLVHTEKHDKIIRFQIMQNEDSEILESTDKTVMLIPDRDYTYPLVDMFGYLVGINVGTAYGEIVSSLIAFKATKL